MSGLKGYEFRIYIIVVLSVLDLVQRGYIMIYKDNLQLNKNSRCDLIYKTALT